MSWSKYLTISLTVSAENAIGSAAFNGAGSVFKLPAGNYRIEYETGGVISTQSSTANPKFNRFELVPGGMYFGKYTPSFFKEQKRYVWQCAYGTLPGFTEDGFNNPEVAKYDDSIEDLEFTLNNTSIVNFWYTDDCPACAQGTIVYNLYRYDESSSYVNRNHRFDNED